MLFAARCSPVFSRATALSLLCVTALAGCGAKTGLRLPDVQIDVVDAADVPDVIDVPPNNVGREYWAVSLLNSELATPLDPSEPPPDIAGFPFAIAVANPSSRTAHVRITGGEISAELDQDVGPGQLQTIRLPWVPSVSQVAMGGGHSVFAAGAAYHVQSSEPVAVYQFNPLSFRDVRRDLCNPSELSCFTFTNDSSLLLPVDVLTGNYTAVAWPTIATDASGFPGTFSGGFVTIVGTRDGTNVTVQLTGNVGGGDGVPAARAHSTITRTLNAGDVWELVSGAPAQCITDTDPMCQSAGICLCLPQADADLTGSVITADAPVAVFGGHDCASVPFNRPACDHLEEQLFPVETVGLHYVASHTVEQLGAGEPNFYRVMSDVDGNDVTFSASVHPAAHLNRGEFVEFVSRADFEVRGTRPVTVAQYFVGQNYFDVSAMISGENGDPSLTLEVPEEQWRVSYDFLSPSTYSTSYVNIVAPHGAQIQLDGHAINSFPRAVGGYDVFVENLTASPGAHHVQSSTGAPFGIKVYGFAPYTSYMNPGGLDLKRLAP